MSVLPMRVSPGELLSISAEPPENCNPFFFDLAPGGRLTPLPINIFDVTETRVGFIRYDNNKKSKYGITVQPEDERGAHHMGFICQPKVMSEEDIRSVFKNLSVELIDRNAGKIRTSNLSLIFNTSQYVITD